MQAKNVQVKNVTATWDQGRGRGSVILEMPDGGKVVFSDTLSAADFAALATVVALPVVELVGSKVLSGHR